MATFEEEEDIRNLSLLLQSGGNDVALAALADVAAAAPVSQTNQPIIVGLSTAAITQTQTPRPSGSGLLFSSPAPTRITTPVPTPTPASTPAPAYRPASTTTSLFRAPSTEPVGIIAGVDVDALRRWLHSSDMRDPIKRAIDNQIEAFKTNQDAARLSNYIHNKAGQKRYRANGGPVHIFPASISALLTNTPVSRPTTPSAYPIQSVGSPTPAGATTPTITQVPILITDNPAKRPASVLTPNITTVPQITQIPSSQAASSAYKRPRIEPLPGTLASINSRPNTPYHPSYRVSYANMPTTVTGTIVGTNITTTGTIIPPSNLPPALAAANAARFAGITHIRAPAAPATTIVGANAVVPEPAAVGRTNLDDLQDITQYTGINMAEESERILPVIPPDGASFEADSGDPIQINHEYIEKVVKAKAKLAGLRAIHDDVYELMAQAVQQQLRNILEEVIVISKHRIELNKFDQETVPISNVKRQLWLLEKTDRDFSSSRFGDETDSQRLARERLKARTEDPRYKTQMTNSAALAAAGITQKSWMMGASTSTPMSMSSSSSSASSTSAATTSTPAGDDTAAAAAIAAAQQKRNQGIASSRRLSLKDLLYYLEHDRLFRKSKRLYSAHLRQR